MQSRKLGNSKGAASTLEVSSIGLGCMGMSYGYGPVGDKQEMIKVIHSAVEQGGHLIQYCGSVRSVY